VFWRVGVATRVGPESRKESWACEAEPPLHEWTRLGLLRPPIFMDPARESPIGAWATFDRPRRKAERPRRAGRGAEWVPPGDGDAGEPAWGPPGRTCRASGKDAPREISGCGRSRRRSVDFSLLIGGFFRPRKRRASVDRSAASRRHRHPVPDHERSRRSIPGGVGRAAGGRWWVSFGRVLPPNVAESPGAWCVTVDIKAGQPDWFEAL
jgi:hypothetical protein